MSWRYHFTCAEDIFMYTFLVFSSLICKAFFFPPPFLQFSMQIVFLLRFEYFLWQNINISTNLFGFVNIPFSTVPSSSMWIMNWIMLLTVHHSVLLLLMYGKVCYYLLWVLQKVLSLMSTVLAALFFVVCQKTVTYKYLISIYAVQSLSEVSK